ncbi:MAG: alpha/beta hydrolase [bacterium]|nr:alpha/beta hydrolase [bacterium]
MEETSNDREITDGTDTARDRSLAGVTKPIVTVYLPKQEKRTGVAVVVCPGGGFSHLAYDKEGLDVGRWLAGQGIAGVVLKYRLPDPDVGLYVRNGSVVDMQRAIRLTRHRAGEWDVAKNKIGVMGFSAGGYLAALAGTMFDQGDPAAADAVERESSRPDFVAPIYPLVSLTALRGERMARLSESMLGPGVSAAMVAKYSPEQQVRADSPPAFLVHAHDDGLPSTNSTSYYEALRKAGVSAELHIYSGGGHGFGIRARGLPVSDWPQRWLAWLRVEKILE